MRPIRKQELEYLDNLIRNKFDEKTRAISSQCEMEVSKQMEKDFDKFIETLKLDKTIKEAQIAEKDYEEFKKNKDRKETELSFTANKKRTELYDKVQRWSEIRDWQLSRAKSESVDSIMSMLKSACRDELETKYKNSEKGKVFKYLENGNEDARNILFSGLSIEDVWRNLEQVFGKAQIEVRVPKSFAQIAK
jgi:hypothetical protein